MSWVMTVIVALSTGYLNKKDIFWKSNVTQMSFERLYAMLTEEVEFPEYTALWEI